MNSDVMLPLDCVEDARKADKEDLLETFERSLEYILECQGYPREWVRRVTREVMAEVTRRQP